MTQEPFTNTIGAGAHNFLNPDNIRNNRRRLEEGRWNTPDNIRNNGRRLEEGRWNTPDTIRNNRRRMTE